jgi:putative ABC transport system permease protein
MDLGTMTEDVRYALRSLKRVPGFTAIVVLTLGLGIGVNSAIYSVIHGALIQSLPYEGGDADLVQLRQPAVVEGNSDLGFSVQEILEYRERSTVLTDLAEHHTLSFNVTGLGEPMRIRSGVVSANFFETLGVGPLHGRLFIPADDVPGATAVIVLTHDFWMNALGGDAEVVGRTLEMNDLLHTVIGILPPVPLYPQGADLYITTTTCPFRSSDRWIETRTIRGMSVFGRMRESADIDRLGAELATIAETMHREHPEAYSEARQISTRAIPLRAALVENGRSTFLILFAAAGFVLLIAVANVANLSLARLVRRERELTVRSALGAERRRLVKLVLTESAILGAAGGAVGLILASWGIDLLSDFAAGYTARATEIGLSVPVLLFTLVTAVGAGLGAGGIPVLLGVGRSGGRMRIAGGSATADGGKRRLQSGMVVGQVAVSFVLLVAAGLTVRSLDKLYGVDPGFSTEEVLTMEIPALSTRSGEESRRFYQDLLTRVRGLPSVEAASIAMTFPLDGLGQMDADIRIDGREQSSDEIPPEADVRTVTAGYFETMGIEIIRGRAFTEEDEMDAAPVAVINRAMATRLFPEQDPLGRQVSWRSGDASWLTVVGISEDVRHYGMGDVVENEIYQPAMMMMNSLLVRSSADPSVLLQPITAVVRELDPKQPVANVSTMGDRRTASLAPARLITSLLGLFAALAALITAAGIGGVIAFTVSQRRKELGIRLALGASRHDLVNLLLRQGFTLTAIGLSIGVAASVGVGRYIEGLLFGIESTDPLTFIGVGISFFVISLVAVLIPARRVSGIHPRAVLTSD